jgi:GH43 family beta-xylosidase
VPERPIYLGQDPWVVPFEGAMLLVQSVEDDRIVVRRFPELARLDDFEETVVWAPRQGDHAHELWAPELHHFAGRWYLYYAASDGHNENHRMYVLAADHPLGPYQEVGQVRDPAHDTWAIDMTVLDHAGRLYAIWSGWEHNGDGFPQNLYIAPMADPATICGERQLLSVPEHDWERSVAPINEGPQVVRNPAQGKLFVMFSADASWTVAYKLGLLEWVGGDVGRRESWRKAPAPILTGGGHGCVVEEDGVHHLVYHRKLSSEPGWGDREIRIAPLSWDATGHPVINSFGPPV